MSVPDHSPLSAACVRALCDKVYDKRKAAAIEIETLVRHAVAANNLSEIKHVIDVLEEYALTLNPHIKKGGLIGLAAAAAGLGTQNCRNYVSDIIKPIVACLSDNNPNVRYYAAESLYNVVRVARQHILPVFGELFTAVTMLVTDPDHNVRVGADMLDTTMKGIIKECGTSIELCSLIPVLRPKLYSNNSTLQTLLVSWVSVLHGMPVLDLVPFLTELLDALQIVLTSPHQEVVRATDTLLLSLLESCRDHPESVNCLALTPQLVVHAQAPNVTLKNMALCWLNELLTLGGRLLLPHAAPILAAALPSMAQPSTPKSHGVAVEVSDKIMRLLGPADGGVVQDKDLADLPGIVCVLLIHLRGDSERCKYIALHWLHHLLKHFPLQMRGELENLCSNILPVLSDPSDDVVVLVLVLLAAIAGADNTLAADAAAPDAGHFADGVSSTPADTDTKGNAVPPAYFRRVLRLLLEALASDKQLLDNRGPLILRELCVLLSPQEVYVCVSELLQQHDVTQSAPPHFMPSMARNMATILLTSRELFPLRRHLRTLASKESCELFTSLFKCWSHSPVSVILLCLLSQNYAQSAVLVRLLADAEVTVEFLVEVDKLVQLIESPIFTYLRLDLLNNDGSSKALVETLYGLLMILPQSSSYTTLATRLRNLPPPHRTLSSGADTGTGTGGSGGKDVVGEKSKIDFAGLLEHFKSVQRARRDHSLRSVQDTLQRTASIDTLLTAMRVGDAAGRGEGLTPALARFIATNLPGMLVRYVKPFSDGAV